MHDDKPISKVRLMRFVLMLFFLWSLALFAPQATAVAQGAGTVPATYPAWWQLVKSANQKSLNALWGDSTQGFFAVGDDGLILHTTRAPSAPMDDSWLVMSSNTTARL
ncbi:MAG: hypothetical protein R3E79_25055 [Caldilineaceae bacterium]